MSDEKQKIVIPEHVKQVAREFAAIAKRFKLFKFDATYQCHPLETKWRNEVHLKWRPGRHEQDVDKVEVWSEFREMVSIEV